MSMPKSVTSRFGTFESILATAGHPLHPEAAILDFGCGGGDLVKAAYMAGYDAHGCDIDFSSEWVNKGILAHMMGEDRVRRIIRDTTGKFSPGEAGHYRLPFDDASFDAIVSDQVFEHLQNYETVLRELARVLKPGGVMLHIFPARWRPLEGHIFVPFASVFRARWWLRLWAALGVRNPYQQGMTVAEAVASNDHFLANGVNYPRWGVLRRLFEAHFRLENAEGAFMAQSKRAKIFLLPVLYRNLHSHVLVAVNKR